MPVKIIQPNDVLYEIGVLHYNFDSSNNNVRLYKSKTERDTLFQLLVEHTNQQFNVPFVANINMSLPFNFDTTNVVNILNYNYCVIKTKDNEYFYYFISNTTQMGGQQTRLDLTLDVIQTYYYDCEFPLAKVNQAHLDRFIPAPETGKYQFNYLQGSKLFSNNLQDLPKFCAVRSSYPTQIDSFSTNSDINKVLTNIAGWVYVYVNPKTSIIPVDVDEFRKLATSKGSLELGLYTWVSPIYKDPLLDGVLFGMDLDISSTTISPRFWDHKSLLNVIQTDPANIVNMKFSPTPPLPFQQYIANTDYYYTDIIVAPGETRNVIVFKCNQHLVDINPLNKFNGTSTAISNSGEGATVFQLYYQPPTSSILTINLPVFKFTLNQIIDKTNNLLLEPHLLSSKVRELQVVDYNGNRAIYDMQKIGTPTANFLIDENFYCDNTQIYLRYQGDNQTLYTENTAYNMSLGLMNNTNLTIPIDIDQLSAFLAQNKNFMQIQQMNRDYSLGKSLLPILAILGGIGISLATLGAGSEIGGLAIAGGIAGIAGQAGVAGAGYALSSSQQNLTLDNMRSAPDAIKNTNTSLLYALLSSPTKQDINYYFEIHEATETDTRKAFWSLFLNGYPLNLVDNIKNYDSSRHVFNYIQAEIEVIEANISNDVKNMIKSIFNKGIRFWHQDNIDYDVANYETTFAGDTIIESTKKDLDFIVTHTHETNTVIVNAQHIDFEMTITPNTAPADSVIVTTSNNDFEMEIT